MSEPARQLSVMLGQLGLDDMANQLNRQIANIPNTLASVPMLKRQPKTIAPPKLTQLLDIIVDWKNIDSEGLSTEERAQATMATRQAEQLQQLLSNEALGEVMTPVAQRYVP